MSRLMYLPDRKPGSFRIREVTLSPDEASEGSKVTVSPRDVEEKFGRGYAARRRSWKATADETEATLEGCSRPDGDVEEWIYEDSGLCVQFDKPVSKDGIVVVLRFSQAILSGRGAIAPCKDIRPK